MIARSAGQYDLLDRLHFILSVPYFGSKLPHLLLLRRMDGSIYSAAILLEYRLLRWRSGIIIPVDHDGELSILAAPEHRFDAAVRTAGYLLRRGARLVLISGNGLLTDDGTESVGNASPLGTRTRVLQRTLLLRATLDETLAQMGARSRRNLRHAARQAVKECGATFHPDAEITEAALVEFNRICLYPVPDWVARWRYSTARTHGFLSGLRAADGRWLSLLGGRRMSRTSIVDWQMNRTDLGSLSIGTAMRLFQIKCEIGRGASALQFSGGTPHSIQNAFVPERVTDLLWMRRLYSHRKIRLLAAKLAPAGSVLRAALIPEKDGRPHA